VHSTSPGTKIVDINVIVDVYSPPGLSDSVRVTSSTTVVTAL
jgi:hypothetical protein